MPALQLALQLTDALHFTHDHGYTHADVKAGNICFGACVPAAPAVTRAGLKDDSKIHLIDYGIAVKFGCAGVDARRRSRAAATRTRRTRASATTARWPSPASMRTGHAAARHVATEPGQGVQGSRRGDLEILGYVLLQWLGQLPWCAPVAWCLLHVPQV